MSQLIIQIITAYMATAMKRAGISADDIEAALVQLETLDIALDGETIESVVKEAEPYIPWMWDDIADSIADSIADNTSPPSTYPLDPRYTGDTDDVADDFDELF